MTWEPEIEELRRREALTEQMGGADKVARQHHFGKLTIRERIAEISDAESFHEVGKLAGVAAYGDDGEMQDFTPARHDRYCAEGPSWPAVRCNQAR